VTFRDNLSVPLSRTKKSFLFFLNFLNIEDVADKFPETSVKNCHSMMRNISEEHKPHQHRGRSLKSRIMLQLSIFYNKDENYTIVCTKVHFSFIQTRPLRLCVLLCLCHNEISGCHSCAVKVSVLLELGAALGCDWLPKLRVVPPSRTEGGHEITVFFETSGTITHDAALHLRRTVTKSTAAKLLYWLQAFIITRYSSSATYRAHRKMLQQL
jgi:hypothetical protein